MIKVDKELSLSDHLDELRRRSLVVLLAFIVFAGISFYFVEDILRWLKIPSGSQLGTLAVFSPTTAILSFMKIAFFVGFIFSTPVFLYEMWMFILPALEQRYSRLGSLFILLATSLFMGGVLFSFYALIPASLKFLLSVGKEELQFIISLDSYISFVVLLLIGGGLVFEMPLVVFTLAKLGILTSQKMIRGWKAALVFIVIGAAALTPTPDIVNMVLMSMPLFILYILSIGVAKLAEKSQYHTSLVTDTVPKNV